MRFLGSPQQLRNQVSGPTSGYEKQVYELRLGIRGLSSGAVRSRGNQLVCLCLCGVGMGKQDQLQVQRRAQRGRIIERTATGKQPLSESIWHAMQTSQPLLQ